MLRVHMLPLAGPVLQDFGLVNVLTPGATHVSNVSSGTPFYIAPEVCELHRASAASDIYALGVITWCARLEGRRHHPGVGCSVQSVALCRLHSGVPCISCSERGARP